MTVALVPNPQVTINNSAYTTCPVTGNIASASGVWSVFNEAGTQVDYGTTYGGNGVNGLFNINGPNIGNGPCFVKALTGAVPGVNYSYHLGTVSPLVSGPFDVVAAVVVPNTNLAYVANNADNSVSVINVSTGAVTSTISVGASPYSVAVTPDGTKAYVANWGSGTVSVINVSTGAVTSTISVGGGPIGVAVTPDGTKAYVTNYSGGTVSVINVSTGAVASTITVGILPQGVAVTPDGTKAYVTNYSGGTVSVINVSTGGVTSTITVGSGTSSVAFTPDGTKAYVTNYSGNTVSVINVSTGTVASTISVGSGPQGVAFTPDGTKAYVTNYSDGTVSVINVSTGAVASTIAVGASPYGVAVTPDGTRVYVTNAGGRSVSVINVSTGAVASTIAVGTNPYGIAFLPMVAATGGDTTAPFFSSASSSVDGTQIFVAFSDADNTIFLPASGSIGGFSVNQGATSFPVNSAVRKGTTGLDASTWVLSLSVPLNTRAATTLAYAQGGTLIHDAAGNSLLSFSAQGINNNTSDRNPPTFLTASTDQAGTHVILVLADADPDDTFLQPASNSVDGFSVQQGATAFTVTSATRQGSSGTQAMSWVLTLASPMLWATTTTISYVPGSTRIVDLGGMPLAAFATQPVTSHVVARTPPVFVSATSDNTGSVFFVTLGEYDNPPVAPSVAFGFTVNFNGSAQAVQSATRQSNGLIYRLVTGSAATCETSLSISYNASTGNVTDSCPIPNRMLSFSGAPCSNVIDDHVNPVFSFAFGSSDGRQISVRLREQCTPPLLPAPPTQTTGFFAFVNNTPRDITDQRITSDGLTVVLTLAQPFASLDAVAVSYNGGNVVDSSAAANPLTPFSFQSASNNLPIVLPPLFDALVWLRATSPSPQGFSVAPPTGDLLELRDGFPLASTILDTAPPQADLVINEDSATGGMAVHHFAVYGATQVSGGSGSPIDLTLGSLYEAAKFFAPGDQSLTAVSLFLKATAPLTNPAETLTASLYSDYQGQPNVSLAVSAPFFYNALTSSYAEVKWLLSAPTIQGAAYWIVVHQSAAPSGGQVKMLAYASGFGTHAASVDGLHWTAVNAADGAYTLYGQNTSLSPLAGTIVLEDPLGVTIRQAVNFGGAVNTSSFESIGYGDRRLMVYRITPNGGVYPNVSAIEFGVTASKPKSFWLEFQTAPGGKWNPLLSFIADATPATRSYYRYVFPTPAVVSAARLRYRGDFYATANDGTLTLSAQDLLSDVTSYQVSHFQDFRDAGSWLPFTEGTTLLPWPLVDTTRTWSALSGVGNPLTALVPFGGQMVAAGGGAFYRIGPELAMTLVYQTSDATHANCMALHGGHLYAGMSGGKVLVSASGLSYAAINPTTTLDPVTSLCSYGGRLWIGTSASSGGLGRLYTWDGTVLALVRSFPQPNVLTMAAAHGSLYVGTGGSASSGAATIYRYDGTSWSLSLTPTGDSVDALTLSTADGRLWAGVQGGVLMALSFDTSGLQTTWKTVYQGDAADFYGLSDDPNGLLLWAQTPTGVLVYVNAQTYVLPVPEPVGAIASALCYLGQQAFIAASNGRVYALAVADVASRNRRAYVRFQDGAGNQTPIPGLSDTVLQDSPQSSASGTPARISDGHIYQVRSDKTVIASLVPNTSHPLIAPQRTLREYGNYEAEPFYSATLTRWDTIAFLGQVPAGSAGGPGLDSGVEVVLKVRTAATRAACLTATWTQIGDVTNIGGGAAGVFTSSFNIASLDGKWLQYRLELTTASRNVTPVIQNVVLTYKSSQSTFFFSTMFDTSTRSTNSPPPQYRRGLLTANLAKNGGDVRFGYTTDRAAGNTFDFTRYTEITQNTVFELPVPSQYIRFAALLVSVDSAHPAIMDEFGVMMDAGPALNDMHLAA